MRADRIAPVTWLLAAAAAWAVLGAALAAAGMGGRIGARDAAGIEAQALPQPAAAASDAIAPVAFDAFTSRPPFAQDRQPHPFSLPGGGGEARADATAFDFALTSVLITPRLRLAIVEPGSGGESVRVREGESAEGLGGWRLVELHPRTAVFEGPGGRRELELRVWAGGDGTGASASGGAPSVGGVEAPPAAPPAPTQVTQQMEAIRNRIEARRAQLRREAAQSQNPAPRRPPPRDTQSPGKPARIP
jgi:general secretion pathway protein N